MALFEGITSTELAALMRCHNRFPYSIGAYTVTEDDPDMCYTITGPGLERGFMWHDKTEARIIATHLHNAYQEGRCSAQAEQRHRKPHLPGTR